MSTFTNDTNCSPYYTEAYDNVAITSAAAAFFSLTAGCFVIFIMILFKKWIFFSQRLILYLAVAAILASISTALHRINYQNQTSEFYDRFCAFSGFVEQITSWILLNAVSSITFYMFANTVLKIKTEKYEVYYFLFIFVFPFSFNWIPFINSSYGRAGAWCWIRSEERDTCEAFMFGQVLIFTLWYIPLYIIVSILVLLYIIILVTMRKTNREWTKNPTEYSKELKKQASREVIPLMAYPLIFFILSIPPLVNRIHNLVSPDNPSLGMWYASALSFPLEGGLIAIAYSLDPETRKRLNWANIRAAFGGCVKKETAEYPVEYVDESYSKIFDTEYKQ